MSSKSVQQECEERVSSKECLAGVSCQVCQECPGGVSSKSVQQECPFKSVPQECPAGVSL